MKSVNVDLLNKAIDGADLRQSEAAELFQITRQTLYNWRQDNKGTSDFLVNRAEKMCEAILSAIAAGRLPLPLETAPSERMKLIKSAMLGK